MEGPPARTAEWLPIWLALAVIWGTAFLFIKLAVADLAPLQVAFGRVAIGAIVVLIVLAVTRTPLPRERRLWLDVAVVGLFANTIPFALFAFGETRISSVLAGIWNATMPIWTVLIGLVLLRGEPVSREKWLGVALGMAGVLIVLGAWQGATGDLLGSLACMGATACYAIATIYTSKRLTGRSEGGMSIIGAQLSAAALQLLLLVVLFTHWPPSISAPAAWSVVALGVVCTGLAFVLVFRLIAVAGALGSSTVTYATPVVSTLAGVLVLGEAFTWNEPVGALVVLLGVALVQGIVGLPKRGARR